MAEAEWQLTIWANRLQALLAVMLAWLLCLPLILWGIWGEPGPVFALMSGAFPAVITYYGLKSAWGLTGRIDIDREGFSVQRPHGGPQRYAWSQVESFFVGRFATGPIYDGMPVPHFRLHGEASEHWLPGNTGLSPDQLVMVMEQLRRLAIAGWPRYPARIGELLPRKSTP